RELNEYRSQTRRVDEVRTNGAMGRDLGIKSLAQAYLAAEDTARTYYETDAQGFRTVRSAAPFAAVLCGDSFANNNEFADSLALTTGLSVGNQAIEGRGTLTMARYLEDRPAAYQHTWLVVWESTQRATVDVFSSLPKRRQQLRQTAGQGWQWRESLLWPGNLNTYLNGTTTIGPLLNRVQKEIKWALLKKHNELIVPGRRDLPASTAPMMYLGVDEGIKPNPTTPAQLDSIADYIAAVNVDLRHRGQILVFAVAPEKSLVYPDRLPAGMVARTNYIPGLTQALQRRGVRVVDVSLGLQQAAQAHPHTLYYYAADTHWTPRGMAVASRIIADSLSSWHLQPPALTANTK
ncbi:MAG: hypothetical protein EOO62_17855, partial [Hymenobacter sp.]